MTAPRFAPALVLILFTGCHAPATPTTPGPSLNLSLPPQLGGKAVVLQAGDPDYPRADAGGAVKPAGAGQLEAVLVVRLTGDVPVWRLWSGPGKKNAQGQTNRIGRWWSYDAPRGDQRGYRTAYEICVSWNDLTWVARCVLKAGAVVAVGPGQSVSPTACGDSSGAESYPANARDWQVYIAQAWTRTGAGKELDCPQESEDYPADPADISRSARVATTH